MTFASIMSVIAKILFVIFGISATAAFLNNKTVKDRIERGGEIIDYSDSSIIERITYFLQDYAYLLVPIYNFKKAVIDNFFKKGASSYEQERRNKYAERKLIRSLKDGESKKVTHKFKLFKEEEKEEKKVTSKEEKKVTSKEEKVVKEKVPSRVATIESNESEIKAPKKDEEKFKSLDEEYSYYKNLFIEKKNEYLKAEDEMKLSYSQRENMYNELLSTQAHLKSLEKRVNLRKEIEAKQNELNSLKELLESENKTLK